MVTETDFFHIIVLNVFLYIHREWLFFNSVYPDTVTKEEHKLNNVLIVFASITTANKIKNELEKRFSIVSKVVQTPKAVPVKSCSYCIKLHEEDLYKAWNMIKMSGVYTKGVYRESDYSKLL